MGSSTYNDALQKELERELMDAGNRLLMLPSSTDELLILLEKVESLLARVWQQPPKSTGDALVPAMKALVANELLHHTDVNIQVAVASCINELTRITAPEQPYNDDKMKEVFQLFMVAFKHLSHDSGSNYLRALLILETMAMVRSCLILMDIDCYATVVEMFQLFFSAIRSNHSSNIFKYMETVMTLVIEESDEVTLELLRPLLDSVRMDNKNISPLSWELGKSVFECCATKIQPYLREAVKPLKLEIDDYAEVVASLCKDTSNGENMVAKEVQGTAQFVAAGPFGDVLSKLDGISEAEQEDCPPQVVDGNGNKLDDKNSLETLKCCEQIVQLKSNHIARCDIEEVKSAEFVRSGTNARSSIEQVKSAETVKSEADARSDIEEVKNANNVQSEPSARSNIGQLKSAEIVQSETDRGAVRRRRGIKPNSLMRPEEGYAHTWTTQLRGSFKVSRDGNKKKKKDLHLPLELGKANTPSASSQKEVDSVNEESIHKRGHSKKGKGMMNKYNDQGSSLELKTKTVRSKGNERGSNTCKITSTKVAAGSSTVIGGDSEGKDKVLLQERSGMEEIRDDVMDEMVEPLMSKTAKKKSSGNLAQEKEKKARRSDVEYGEELLNSRIMVWWPIDKTFYTGTVEAFDPSTKKHKIKYDDEEEELLNLKNERWELFSYGPTRQTQPCTKLEAEHPFPAKEPVKTAQTTSKRKPGSSRKQPKPSSSKRPKTEG